MLHQVGVGVLGPVYRTYDPDRDRLISVKAFRLDLLPEQVRSFAAELERLVALDPAHPSVVRRVAAGVEGHVAYLAEDYIAAESLDVALRHYAPAPLETALPFIRQLAGAVDSMRAAGTGHGALHPRDIFLTPDEARATGFGVAGALEAVGMAAPIRRPYSAPERVAGGPWGSPADVYALGAIAHELLTGRRPAGTGEVAPVAGKVAATHPQLIRAVLAIALAERPDERYQTAGAFAEALEAAALGEPARVTAEPSLLDLPGVEPEAPRSIREARLPDGSAGLESEPAAPFALDRTLDGRRVPESGPEPDPRFEAEPAFEPGQEFEVEPDPGPEAGPAPDEAEDEDRALEIEAADAIAPDTADEDGVLPPEPPEPLGSVPAGRGLPPTPTWEIDTPRMVGQPSAERGLRAMLPYAAVLVAGLVAGFLGGYVLGSRDGTPASAPTVEAEPPSSPDTGQPFSEATVAPAQPAAPPAPSVEAPAVPSAQAASAAGQPGARLVVRSTPSGARVRVNGEDRGETPLTLSDLALGAYDVEVIRDGYRRASRQVSLTDQLPTRELTFPLEAVSTPAAAAPGAGAGAAAARPPAAAGTLVADSRPRGARVFLDGRPVGTTPLRLTTATPGRHDVRLELSGYRTWRTEVTIVAGRETRVSGSLERRSP